LREPLASADPPLNAVQPLAEPFSDLMRNSFDQQIQYAAAWVERAGRTLKNQLHL
jgi:hypothetical protein